MGSSSKEPLHFERSEIFLRNLIQWYSLTLSLSLSLSLTHTHRESTPVLVCKRDSQRDTQFLFSIKLFLYVYISFLLMNMMVKDMWKWIMGWKVIGIGISRIYISHSASKIGVFMWMADGWLLVCFRWHHGDLLDFFVREKKCFWKILLYPVFAEFSD
jgi:hypothetical protein